MMKSLIKKVIRYVLFVIATSCWLLALIWGSLGLADFSDTVASGFMIIYLALSVILYIYFHKRNKLDGNRSFSSVIFAIKNDTKNGITSLIKEAKQLIIGLAGLAFIVLIFGIGGWVVISVGQWVFSSNDENTSIIQEHPNYEAYKKSKDCSTLEPDNPYDYDSGHYAGFEWGQNGNSCVGNSTSFIEGCEEYEIQESAYDACLSNQ